ncbi:MAG: haloacid dehalogenase type II [Gammaproteobacteria bacterium]|nr:haloacid dehalogenase type II [Gammaproteobacteria bacterium]
MNAVPIKALFFDVFGTVVDWRNTIIKEGEILNRSHDLDVDWARFADRWRGMYQPAMEQVRNGTRPWTVLDTLHRESLETLIDEFGLQGLDSRERDELNRVWHRLDPWPDSVAGLAALKRRFIVAPLSNGNVSLLVNMAKYAGLPWDVILGAEVAGHYKPQPEAYLAAARLLDLPPAQCMMVAAHNDDLEAASGLGFQTAFVARPLEHGPNQQTDLAPTSEWNACANGIDELAGLLGGQ